MDVDGELWGQTVTAAIHTDIFRTGLRTEQNVALRGGYIMESSRGLTTLLRCVRAALL